MILDVNYLYQQDCIMEGGYRQIGGMQQGLFQKGSSLIHSLALRSFKEKIQ